MIYKHDGELRLDSVEHPEWESILNRYGVSSNPVADGGTDRVRIALYPPYAGSNGGSYIIAIAYADAEGPSYADIIVCDLLPHMMEAWAMVYDFVMLLDKPDRSDTQLVTQARPPFLSRETKRSP